MQRTRFMAKQEWFSPPRIDLLQGGNMRKDYWASGVSYVAVAALAGVAAWLLAENLPGVASLAPGNLLKVL